MPDTAMKLVTTGDAVYVPTGKIKPIRETVRHVVPVEIRRVVSADVPVAGTVLKGRSSSHIHAYDGRFFRETRFDGSGITPWWYDSQAEKGEAECPSWRRDAATWDGTPRTVADLAVKRLVDSGWEEAYLRATKAAEGILAYGQTLMHEIPAPSVRVRFNPGANVGSEVVVETVFDHMSRRDVHVRFNLGEAEIALRLAEGLVAETSEFRKGMPAYHPPRQKIERFRVGTPSEMPRIGVPELAEDIAATLDAFATNYVASYLDADRLEAFAMAKGMVASEVDETGIAEAVDLLCLAVDGVDDRDNYNTGHLFRMSIAARTLFPARLATLGLDRRPTP